MREGFGAGIKLFSDGVKPRRHPGNRRSRGEPGSIEEHGRASVKSAVFNEAPWRGPGRARRLYGQWIPGPGLASLSRPG